MDKRTAQLRGSSKPMVVSIKGDDRLRPTPPPKVIRVVDRRLST